MENTLRPLTLGEILDRTAQLYRSNFLLFAGIAAVYSGIALIIGLLQIALTEILRTLHLTTQLQWFPLVAAGASILLMFLFSGTAIAANNRAVSWVHLGEAATIRSAYASVLPRLGRYLWLMTIAAFVVWTPLALVYGGYFGFIFLYLPKGFLANPSAIDSSTSMVFLAASVIFFLLLIPAGIYAILMGLRYALAVPACVVEELPARKALRRSVELSKGARGRIFVLGLLVIAIEMGLVFFAQIFFVIAAFQHPGHLLPVWIRVTQQIVGFCTNTFIGPIYATALTLFYYDQRVRKEGYDIERMMQAAGLTVPAPLLPSAEEAAEGAA
jgi:uncharacterized membrane protein